METDQNGLEYLNGMGQTFQKFRFHIISDNIYDEDQAEFLKEVASKMNEFLNPHSFQVNGYAAGVLHKIDGWDGEYVIAFEIICTN